MASLRPSRARPPGTSSGKRDREKESSLLRTDMCTVTCVYYIFLISFFLFSHRESSVLRTGTWDLSLRLLTKLASLQVLASLASSPNHVPTYDWFKVFLFDRLADFEGHSQRKGVDGAFLDELMLQPPRISEKGFVDPMLAAEMVIACRSRIAEQWRKELRDVAQSWPVMNLDLADRQKPP